MEGHVPGMTMWTSSLIVWFEFFEIEDLYTSGDLRLKREVRKVSGTSDKFVFSAKFEVIYFYGDDR